MASLRQVAQEFLEIARDGIAYFALYKNGRGWEAVDFWPDIDREGNVRFDDAETDKFYTERLENIAKIDPNAIMLNGYYHNLGDPDEMTRDSLARFLRWQYELGGGTVSEFLETIVHFDENTNSMETRSETADQQNAQNTETQETTPAEETKTTCRALYQVQTSKDGENWQAFYMEGSRYDVTEDLEKAREVRAFAEEWHKDNYKEYKFSRIIKITVTVEEVETV